MLGEDILDEVGTCMQRHAELIEYSCEMRDEISEGHRKAVSRIDKFFWFYESRIGSDNNHY